MQFGRFLLGFLSLAQSFSKCVWCEITCLRVSRVVAVFQCLSRVIWKHNTAFSRWHQTSAGHKSMFERGQMTLQPSLRFRAFGKIYIFILDMFLAGWCSQMSAPLRWLEGAGTIWAVSGRESFQQHLTLRLTHNFIVPMNVLMRQNVFDRKKNPGRHLWIIHWTWEFGIFWPCNWRAALAKATWCMATLLRNASYL